MTPEQAALLRKPFPREVIGKLPKGGANLDYVGHAATTDRLLQADPEWSWEPLATDEHGLPLLDRSGNLWIRLTVCGHTRIGVGDGKSAKECIGDAIRNAAMRFGVALDLWSKDELEQTSGEGAAKLRATLSAAPPLAPAPLADPAPVAPAETGEAVTPAQIAKMGAMMRELGMTDRRAVLAWVGDLVERPVESRNDLTKQEARKVIDALEKEKGA
jgi:hypothetical protein